MSTLFNPWQSTLIGCDIVAEPQLPQPTRAQRRARRWTALLHAAGRSRLYSGLMGRGDLRGLALADFPPQRKADLMAGFDDWVTDDRLRLEDLRTLLASAQRVAEPYLGQYTVWESSGSTGEPGVFVQDMAAMAVYDALEAFRRPAMRPLQRLWDPCYLGERIAFVGATSGHFASTVSMLRLCRINPVLGTRLRLVSFLQPLPELVSELQSVAPTVLATYPTSAVLLAEEQAAGRLALRLNEVWTGGETLSPAMRQFVQDTFGCPVVNSYGASEFLAMACECPLGQLHLNDDWVILEPVDAGGRAVPPGQAGATTLLTNLANHVQPLIRYDLGDRVAIMPGPCPCGSALPVVEVNGRQDDMLRLGPRDHVVCLLPLALSTVLEDEAGLFDFQLVQRGPCDLLLSTGLTGPAATEALKRASRALHGYLCKQGLTEVRIHCRPGQPGRLARSGKIPRVVALG